VPFYVGQDATVKATIRNPDGTAANPTSVTFRVKPPVGTAAVYTLGLSGNISEEEPGLTYNCTFDLNLPGPWYIRAEGLDGSASVIGVAETTIMVLGSKIV